LAKRFVSAGVVLGVLISMALMPAIATSDDAAARLANPFEGRAEVIPEGKSLFNQYCSHCHGPDAVQGERPRDLRRLNIRHRNDAIVVFYNTTNNGRMDKGMPVWKGILSEEVMWKIYTFLSSIQTQP
jgi:mono/diheme cytochrome c family protein